MLIVLAPVALGLGGAGSFAFLVTDAPADEARATVFIRMACRDGGISLPPPTLALVAMRDYATCRWLEGEGEGRGRNVAINAALAAALGVELKDAIAVKYTSAGARADIRRELPGAAFGTMLAILHSIRQKVMLSGRDPSAPAPGVAQ